MSPAALTWEGRNVGSRNSSAHLEKAAADQVGLAALDVGDRGLG
jgi:hypothetical protein